MEATPAAQIEKETTLAYLEQWHEVWSPLYNRVLRTGGLDAQLNHEFAPVNARMNSLLDQFNDIKILEQAGVEYESAAAIL